jgi:hypothetical protein
LLDFHAEDAAAHNELDDLRASGEHRADQAVIGESVFDPERRDAAARGEKLLDFHGRPAFAGGVELVRLVDQFKDAAELPLVAVGDRQKGDGAVQTGEEVCSGIRNSSLCGGTLDRAVVDQNDILGADAEFAADLQNVLALVAMFRCGAIPRRYVRAAADRISAPSRSRFSAAART